MKILFCNFVISHICSTYSSCQKGTNNDENAVHSERMGIYNLAKKAHDITNVVNAVHSETMGVYNLAKKRDTLLITQMKCTLHSERLVVYNLARKIKTWENPLFLYVVSIMVCSQFLQI